MLPLTARAQRGHDSLDLLRSVIEPATCLNDEMGLCTLFCIRQLTGEQLQEFCFRHLGPAEDAGALHVRRRANDDDSVDRIVPPRLEQQRNVEHNQIGAVASGVFNKPFLFPGNKGMNDTLQPEQAFRLRCKMLGEGSAINPACLARRSGKSVSDRSNSGAAWFIEAVYGNIRIENGNSQPLEHFGGGGFTHPNGAGQPYNQRPSARHSASAFSSSARAPRMSAGVPPKKD
ncbi:MAG TPA: hypothetical protein VLC74_07505 [Rhizomicrobium sp.]|nr:hypothetical protein [Rhizomicrobium sp.]